jgi:hypothetical protein
MTSEPAGPSHIGRDLAAKLVDDVIAAFMRNVGLADSAIDRAFIAMRALDAMSVANASVCQQSWNLADGKRTAELASPAEALAWTLAALISSRQGGIMRDIYTRSQRFVSLLAAEGFPMDATDCQCSNCRASREAANG